MKNIFPELKGNSIIKDIIGKNIKSGYTNHAYVFEGPAGSGRHTAVMSIIKSYLCENKNDSTVPLPCMKCKSCIKISKGLWSDIEIISNNDKLSIGIQKIRDIKKNLYISPNDGDFKFYIIENAELMTEEAQNALLLSLEEPPEFVVFFLICENSAKLLETIKSRALIFRMQLFTNKELYDFLNSGIKGSKSENEISEICSASNGTLGQAYALLHDTSIIKQGNENIIKSLLNIFQNNRLELIKETQNISYSKEEASLLFIKMEMCIRDIIAVKQAGKSAPLLFFFSPEDIPREMISVSLRKLINLCQNIEKAIYDISYNVNIKATVLSVFTDNL